MKIKHLIYVTQLILIIPNILNTGAPKGCVLSPLLYSLFTHDCVATHASNSIIKFADDTTVRR